MKYSKRNGEIFQRRGCEKKKENENKEIKKDASETFLGRPKSKRIKTR